MKVASLRLPRFYMLNQLTFGNLPAKNGVFRCNGQLGDAAMYAKPFTNSSDNIIFGCVEVFATNVTNVETISFIVHSSTLLQYAPSTSHASPQDVNSIPWASWGPSTTRWFDNISWTGLAFCGQRWLAENEILDFNQYRVRQLGEGFRYSGDFETARISVVTGSIECIYI